MLFRKHRKRDHIPNYVERRDKRWRKRVRKYLLKRYGNVCHWCGEPMDTLLRPGNLDEMATIEHLIALSDGGSNDLSNLRLAHKRCNR